MVKCGIKPLTAIILMLVLIINLIQLPNHASASSGVDEYDMLRSKIYDVLTGGDNFDPTDPDISPRISGIEANGQKYWSTINNEQNRTYLWSDLSDPLGPNMDSTHLSGSYSRLAQMAIAYSTRGTSLYSNPNLLADIISGMDWMYTNRYTLSVPVRGYGNWYDWQISSPNSINTVSNLLYSHLTTQQLSDWHAALDRQTLPLNASNAGANRVWTCNIMITSSRSARVKAILLANHGQFHLHRGHRSPSKNDFQVCRRSHL
ncbi:Xanthan lyase [Paenibacillus allorhizoplanae]|uniref:Xanthan lyase n=1 Tax=Paenibacillus allorhizoplanae TaxID=2905648 RepID=A0ABM9C2R5_9BACL|nr:hypothetical protein [Paenibacillus allorhizoplanae]CAH1202285.1 Xanthan lyase [Paenibacillus allorhizoplanae]